MIGRRDDPGHDETGRDTPGTEATESFPPQVTSCGCGVEDGGRQPRTAVAVDPAAKARNLTRLRRIEGQVRGLQRMVEDDRYCADIMTQIASVHEALRSTGRELMRNHLRHCATAAIRAGDHKADAMYDELLELIYRHVR